MFGFPRVQHSTEIRFLLTFVPCFQMIKAGLEMACFTTHVRLRTLPDSMKTLGLPNIDAMASAKNKNKEITSQYTIGPKCVSQYTYELCIWTNIIAESFNYVNYGLSIIPWKVSQIIWVNENVFLKYHISGNTSF